MGKAEVSQRKVDPDDPTEASGAVEEVEIQGHILDSLILPKILDEITYYGGSWEMKELRVGQTRTDPTYARMQIRAANSAALSEILAHIGDHGAMPLHPNDCKLAVADMDGAFPENFYSTTNQRTQVRVAGKWIEVQRQEMDCGIQVDARQPSAKCLPMSRVRRGDQVVIGRQGVRVFPLEHEREHHLFEFMGSAVSSEKPKQVTVREVASEMRRCREAGGKILVVAGPAVVHTGSAEHFCRLIKSGFIDRLFAGNALATHDIEQALYGTSLGVYLDRGLPAEEGHEHHLRTINTIRRLGGIRQAVEKGVLTNGIMHACVTRGVEYLLAGSIRDDGPLPEVITDVLVAQDRMRERLQDVTFCLMIATTLHSIAVGNLLPAWVRVVCVDINPATVIKLSDRGSFQTVGLVTDAEPFLRALVEELLRSE